MDPEFQCGNDLRLLEWWLIRHGKHPAYSELISDLAQVTQGIVQVVTSAQITNHELAHEFRAEAADALKVATARLASVNAVAAHA